MTRRQAGGGLGGLMLGIALVSSVSLAAETEVVLGPSRAFGPGNACAIRVDRRTGEPHVVWEDREGRLLHSHCSGGTWSEPARVGDANDVGAIATHRAGAVAMEIDPAGRVHVVYIAGNAIHHVHQDGDGWSEPALIYDGGDRGLCWPSLAGTSRGELYLIFEMGHNTRRCHFDGATWSAPVRVDTTNVASHAWDIKVGPDDRPHVVFQARTGENSEAYYATIEGGEWRVTRVTEEEHYVDCPALTIGPSGKLHVIWTVLEETEVGHLKWSEFDGRSRMSGATVPVKTQAHNFSRLLCDAEGRLYAFLPRRFPPKLVVRADGEWLPVVEMGGEKQGFWFLEADAYGDQVHVVHSSWRHYETVTPVTYRRITCRAK